jgi:hypothetical protein
MQIKVTAAYLSIAGTHYREGDVIDSAPDALARHYIERGWAKEVKTTSSKKTKSSRERAVRSPGETADKPKSRTEE